MRTTGRITAVLGLSAALLAVSSPASMASGNDCIDGCLTLFYNSDYQGASWTLVNGEWPNLASATFTGSGAGSGQTVKNNAASADFFSDSDGNAVIYYNSNYQGACDAFDGSLAETPRLGPTYNEDASAISGTNVLPSGCTMWVYNG